MKLLKGAGLDAKRPERLDVAMCTELPVKLVFLPAHDIPMYIMDGNVDIGISGSDMLEETIANATGHVDGESEVKVLMPLGFGKCKLCLQAPTEHCASGPAPFVGKRIVTSFPGLTKKYFDKLAADAPEAAATKVKVVSGSVEAACGLGLADAIVDLVETGTTMRAAGLDIVSEVFSSEAVIMQQTPTLANGLDGAKGDLVKLIMTRIQGYITATRNVYLVFNCEEKNLAACCEVTPGKRSPTITKLQEEGWMSVSVLVEKKSIHTLMDKLTTAGALDLLVTALDNTRK